MRYLIALLLVCAALRGAAQTNYVKNPDLEQYSICPDQLNNVVYCTHWSNIIDTVSTNLYQPEYYNACGNMYIDVSRHIPRNVYFYQYPHSDSGMVGLVLYYDKPPPRRFPLRLPRLPARQAVQGAYGRAAILCQLLGGAY